MKKLLHLAKLLIVVALFLNSNAFKAAPGDTTWVAANNVQLNYYNNFDSTVVFPDGSVSYRKILMIFTLGQYNCPFGETYCHQWDYTVTNYVMTNEDTLELSRFITPYATTGTPGFGSSWKQHYNFDVTDFYHQLKDSATIRILYSGYSGGFTADIKFAFIEGIPERYVLGVDKGWNGYYNYGDDENPIDNNVVSKSFTAPDNAVSAELKFTITGHGADASSQCCEFNNTDEGHDYFLKLNGSQIAQYNIWKNDCGSNELSPQGGTWIFNRANWCPGGSVQVLKHSLPGIAAGSSYDLDVDFENYTNNPTSDYPGYGGYDIGSHVFYYGDFNHVMDASIEDVIAPNKDENYQRENPSGSQPIVRIRNSGNTTITSLQFQYNVQDSVLVNYTWAGNLLPLTDAVITLGALNTLTNMSLDSITNGIYQFNVKIIAVNGVVDEDTTNNHFKTHFIVAPKWNSTVVFTMKTNTEGIGGVGSGNSETSWQITDMDGNVVAERINCELSTEYKDTISFSMAGFYKLTINDLGCDGLHWWLWDALPEYGITPGNFTVRNLGSSANIPMSGYTYTGTYRHDFGCSFTHYFTTEDNATSVNELNKYFYSLQVFPNPAENSLNIKLNGFNNVNGTVTILDALGQTVLENKINTNQFQLNVSALKSGIYNVIFIDSNQSRLQNRIVIYK
jgi:hypothetical protein